jgi:hypothetical protein
MVTPVEKGQGTVSSVGLSGDEPFHQASSEGQGMMFSTEGPLLGNPSGPLNSQYVAYRGAAGWSTVPIDAAQLLVESEGSQVDEFLYFSPTLSCGFDETQEALTALPSGESVGEVQNLYVWDAATDSSRLVTNTDPLNRLNLQTIHSVKFFLYGASTDCSRVVFATEYELLAGAPVSALYEWDEGTLSLVSKLPDGTTVAAKKGNSVIGALSGGGSQILFTAVSDSKTGSAGEIDNGHEEIFMREGGASTGASTVEVSKSQTTKPDVGATFQMGFGEGSSEGSQVLFLANYGLTATSSKGAATSCSATKGCDLYDYNVATKTLTDLSADSNVNDTEGADVFGVLGAGAESEGSYVYFSASGQLVPGKGNTQATNNKNPKEANVYVAHAGHIEYIAKIPQGTALFGNSAGQNASGQTADFVAAGAQYGNYTARVTPSGRSLLFGDEGNEIAAATDNGYNNDNAGGEAQDELYLYSAQANTTACVTCDPSGARPLSFLTGTQLITPYGFNNGYAEHNLSESGERVFFNSPDEMTPEAVAAGASINAYEWEPEGSGASCPVLEHPSSSGGCIFLLASGGEVLDATPSGDDVFVNTRVPLVAQDLDGLNDVYDLKVDGGFAAPSSAECSGEECQGALNESLTFASAGSTGSPAVGNASAQPEPKPVTVVTKPKPKPKVLTRAQKLASALKACRKKSKRKRATCESQARKKYGAKVKAKKKAKGKGSSGKGGK